MVGLLLGALDNTIVVTALPSIVTDLHDQSGLAFVVSAYIIAQTIAMPIFGKLSDHYGRRRFFLLGLVVFMLGSILSGTAQDINQLILFRAVQGVGGGAFFPVAMAIIGVIFEARERARLAGAFSAVFGIASVVGPLLGDSFVQTIGWRWIFYINLPLGLASMVIVFWSLGPLRDASPKSRFDWQGASLLSGWVIAIMLVLEETANGWLWTDPQTIGLVAVGAALFAAFVWWERGAKEPVVPLRFFRMRVVSAATSVSFLRGVVMFTALTYVSIFVAFALNGGSADVRNVLYGFLLPMVVGAGLGGNLLPRLGYRPIVGGGMLIMALGSLWLATAGEATPMLFETEGGFESGLFLMLAPVGFGIGLTFAATTLAVQYAVPMKDIGIATSLVQFMANIGGAFGVSVFGSMQQSRLSELSPAFPPVPTPEAMAAYAHGLKSAAATSIHEVFVAVAVVSLICIVPALLVAGKLPEDSQAPAAEAAAEPAVAP